MNWSDRYPALQKIFEKFQKMWLFAMTSAMVICMFSEFRKSFNPKFRRRYPDGIEMQDVAKNNNFSI